VERFGVTTDYFAVMQIPLKKGRVFSKGDRAGSEPVIVIGERTARTLFPDGNAIGQHVRVGGADSGPWRRIVGIVGDVRHQELASPPILQMYTPQAQFTDSFLTVLLQGGRDSAVLADEARRAIWQVASDVPVYNATPLAELVDRSVGPRRFVMVLLEAFGATALLMTAVGLYGVVSCAVTERTRELGIRAALGATRADIARLVLGSGLAVVGIGLTAGTAIAVVATRSLAPSLYEVSPTDPATFGGAIVILLGAAIAAQTAPVLRATRVDPAIALQAE
jgi:hypothetical protein